MSDVFEEKAAATSDGQPRPNSETETVAAGQLRSFIERVERLEEDKKAIADDIREVYAEMKAVGFDTKAVRALVKLRKKDAAERDEEFAMLRLYADALGMSIFS